MANDIPAGWRIREMLPVRGRLQQYRLDAHVTYSCSKCQGEQASRVVATLDWNWSAIICADCYGDLASGKEGKSSGPLVPQSQLVSAKKETGGRPTASSRTREGWRGRPEQLRQDIVQLAAILQVQRGGERLSSSEKRALKALADDIVMPAALRYAEILSEGEDILGRSIGRPAPTDTRILTQRRSDAVRRISVRLDQELAKAQSVGAPAPLSALVTANVAGEAHRKVIVAIARRRGLQPNVLDLPAVGLGAWLSNRGFDRAQGVVEAPLRVRRLQQLPDTAFLQVLTADAQGSRRENALEHPLLVERWAGLADQNEALLRRVRDQCGKALRTQSDQQQKKVLSRWRAACRAHAMAAARTVMSELLVKELRLEVAKVHGQKAFRLLRAALLTEAAEVICSRDPQLARRVLEATDEHIASCPHHTQRNSRHECGDDVARVVRQRFKRSIQPAGDDTAGAPLREAAEGQLVAVESASAVSASCAHGPNVFVCPTTIMQLPANVARITAVTSVKLRPGADRFGYAWVTEHGEVGTGAGSAANLQDAWLQASCIALLNLSRDISNVQVICGDERAASVIRFVVGTRRVPEALGFPVMEKTRELLVALLRGSGKVFACADGCSAPHRGSRAAARLCEAAFDGLEGNGVADAVRIATDAVAQELRKAVREKDEDRSDECRNASWIPGGFDAGELRWRMAVSGAQLHGGWSRFPDGLAGSIPDGQCLCLSIEHEYKKGKCVQAKGDVLLRRIGDHWELHGVQWPKGMLPGTFVSFRWRPSETIITAWTRRLPQAERIDDLRFEHQYDVRVVTRDAAPGSGYESNKPDLTEADWILRTLRTLGHLSADGTATLAEPALVRNCLDLGMPQHQIDRISSTVERLIQEKRIQRVSGSFDQQGHPWHPPRRGLVPIALLRYVPRAEKQMLQSSARFKHESGRQAYLVSGFVRRLPAGAQASEYQIEAHEDAIRAAEVVNRKLPDGYTFVRKHRRGSW